MSYHGPEFYDDAAVFSTYMKHRETPGNANDTLDRPIVLDLLGDVANRRILDLGCGDAAFGRELLAAGARSYHGVDGSANMIDRARQNLAGTAGTAEQCALGDWSWPPEQFDLVTSRLALHYIADLGALLHGVRRTLRPGGRLVYSVEHPVITAFDNPGDDDAPSGHWIIDNYFVTGPRVTAWLGGEVIKYHRTVEDHVAALLAAGFAVRNLRESRPDRAHIADAATFASRQRVPLFLFMAAERT